MSNWVDGVDDDLIFDDGEQDYFHPQADDGAESAEDEDEDVQDELPIELQWATAKEARDFEVDGDGNRFEIVKKVREYHVDRPITAADIRARFEHFGKGTSDQTLLVSKEPPLALELGTVDSFERESRTEVKRFIHEASTLNVTVKDTHLAIVAKEERQRKQAEEGRAAAGSSDGTGRSETWGGNRGTAARTSHDDDDEVACRIRVTNLSGNITETNLRDIFSSDDMVVERVFLPTDKKTGALLGYAFLTFKDKWMAENALHKEKLKFKNVVINVSKALNKR